ncbi:MAG: cell wall hydrolase [Clostridiaceae bacterium]|nr:cell wall hydrolase [Clostridiaceae bacterium]
MIKKITSAIMALGIIMSVSSTSVYADTASDKAKIQQVQTQRNDLENKAEIMNSQRETIMSKINSNERNITIIQKNIKQTIINIAKAKENIKAEQIIFNERMRVMYMNGTSSYLDIILGSDGIGDLISRVENIKTIVIFNQKVINALKTKQEAINLKKEALDTENAKLLSLRADNKNELTALTKQKSDQDVLASKLDDLEDQYGAQLVINQAIDAKQAIKAKKDAEAKQALINSEKDIAKQNEASKQVIGTHEAETSTSSELDLLARIITAEAGGESYKAQVAVGAVVLNRVKSSSFPNSIRGVIYEKTYAHYEFTPVLNGNINRPAYASAVKAANEALGGNDPTSNALFFYSGKAPEALTSPQPVSIIIGNLTFINML